MPELTRQTPNRAANAARFALGGTSAIRESRPPRTSTLRVAASDCHPVAAGRDCTGPRDGRAGGCDGQRGAGPALSRHDAGAGAAGSSNPAQAAWLPALAAVDDGAAGAPGCPIRPPGGALHPGFEALRLQFLRAGDVTQTAPARWSHRRRVERPKARARAGTGRAGRQRLRLGMVAGGDARVGANAGWGGALAG